ncbi:hypothetical protein KSB_67980 [Ktedonobacter robiniae]|uniref:Uncharacterized protein n=1 Tax=Ktedonobacter robiniae TaxID=2778365 RepID=A0ABQ3V081_9CHLR|nr:hypothetical protein KSB_67980 [Ktedonobacter robiniae]
MRLDHPSHPFTEPLLEEGCCLKHMFYNYILTYFPRFFNTAETSFPFELLVFVTIVDFRGRLPKQAIQVC